MRLGPRQSQIKTRLRLGTPKLPLSAGLGESGGPRATGGWEAEALRLSVPRVLLLSLATEVQDLEKSCQAGPGAT